MKYSSNIFCSNAAFKLVIIFLSILSTIIILAFLSNTGFAFLSTITNSFQGGFGQKQQQQFKHTTALASATKQLGILQGTFFPPDQNVSDVKDDSGRASQKSSNPYIGVEA